MDVDEKVADDEHGPVEANRRRSTRPHISDRTITMNLDLDIRGARPPCYLLPANGHHARDFDAIRPALARHFETIALDWPAMGSSPASATPDETTIITLADLLEHTVLGRSDEPAVFIGHSIGGFCAARLALRHPELVRGLVLINSGGFYDPGTIGRIFCRLKGHAWVTRHFEGTFARFHTKRRNAHTHAMFERIDAARGGDAYAATVAAVWQSFALPAFDLRPHGTIRCPTLLIWGAHDPVVSLAQAGRGAERAIPGARLVTLDTGHSPFVEDPEAFLEAALPFIAQLLETSPDQRTVNST